jgi:hypothetical protein
MSVARQHLIMLNEKIRKAILEYYYKYWEKEPQTWVSCEHLAEEL